MVAHIAHPQPDSIMTSQFVHRHPRYSAAKPPISGPVTGPFMGPMLQMLNARARYSSVTRSVTVPGEFANIAAPAHALEIVSHEPVDYGNLNVPQKTNNDDLSQACCKCTWQNHDTKE